MPHFHDYAVVVHSPGGVEAESTRVLGTFLRDVMKLNLDKSNFRLFGPDETASNRLEAVYEVTGKTWMAETDPVDTDLSVDGRVMEVLSEHLCEGWLEGYADRPAWAFLVLRGLRPRHRLDGQSTCKVAEGDQDDSVA
jgi:xylulose-5-phosphate/fructose-6-phosphate phosphoketolase